MSEPVPERPTPCDCEGSDDPALRCGFHHPTELASVTGGYECCCGSAWTAKGCLSGAKRGDPVERSTPPDDGAELTSPAVVGPAYAAVYQVIRKYPGSAERNAVIWRAIEAYRGALVDGAEGTRP